MADLKATPHFHAQQSSNTKMIEITFYLAARLGCKKMSRYNYIPFKSERFHLLYHLRWNENICIFINKSKFAINSTYFAVRLSVVHIINSRDGLNVVVVSVVLPSICIWFIILYNRRNKIDHVILYHLILFKKMSYYLDSKLLRSLTILS